MHLHCVTLHLFNSPIYCQYIAWNYEGTRAAFSAFFSSCFEISVTKVDLPEIHQCWQYLALLAKNDQPSYIYCVLADTKPFYFYFSDGSRNGKVEKDFLYNILFKKPLFLPSRAILL